MATITAPRPAKKKRELRAGETPALHTKRNILPLLAGILGIAAVGGYLLQFPEAPLVKLAMVAYIHGTVFYILGMIRSESKWPLIGSFSAVLGVLVHTAAITSRWAAAGHAPFSSMYEMLLCFAWGVALLHIIFEQKYGASYSGMLAMPVAALSLVLLSFMDSSVRPLVPALQSSLLHIHVLLAVISYAAFALSFATALLYLVKDGVAVEAFGAWASGLSAFIYAAVLGAYFRGGKMLLPAWDAAAKQKIMLERNAPIHVAISGLGWLVLAGFVAALLPAAVYLWSGRQAFTRKLTPLLLISLAGQALATGVFVANLVGGPYPAVEVQQPLSTSPMAAPFVIPGLLIGLMTCGLVALFAGRFDKILAHLPAPERLDRLTYRIIQVGLPLLTLMIVAGAFWANRAWGSYWSWDPKEDWALITWFTYAAYLHTRLLKGWRGRRSAYFAIVGFAVVLFTFFGVSYLLSGLHSYA